MNTLARPLSVACLATIVFVFPTLPGSTAQAQSGSAIVGLDVQDAAGVSVTSIDDTVGVDGDDGLLEGLGAPKLMDKALQRSAKQALKAAAVPVSATARYDRTITQEGAANPIAHEVRSIFGDSAKFLKGTLTTFDVLGALRTSMLYRTEACWTPPAEALSLTGTLPLVRIGSIGDESHGKTTLTDAILQVQADQGLPTAVAFGALRGITINTSHVEYATDTRRHAHVTCPDASDYIESMITGAAQMDGAILVVDAVVGPLPFDDEAVRLARVANVPEIVVFLNDVDQVSDPIALDAVEQEVRDLLTRHQYPGNQTPIIRGSALRALQRDPAYVPAIVALLDALDTHIALPVPDADKDFLMSVEDVFAVKGRGTVATGKIETGAVATGDPIEIVSSDAAPLASVVDGIEMFRADVGGAGAGDNAGVLLRGIEKKDIKRGMVIVKPGSVAPHPHSRFTAEVYVLKKEEGGRHTPFHNKYRPSFYYRTTDVKGTIELPPGIALVNPGDHVTVTVGLIAPVAMDKGLRFAIREGGRTVGAGQVTEILE